MSKWHWKKNGSHDRFLRKSHVMVLQELNQQRDFHGQNLIFLDVQKKHRAGMVDLRSVPASASFLMNA
jgi:hypothetical protein